MPAHTVYPDMSPIVTVCGRSGCLVRHGYYSVRSKFGQNNSGKGTPDDASRDSLLLQRTEQEQIQSNNVLLQ